MGKVLKIAISKNSGGEIQSVSNAEAVTGKGLINDRHFKDGNKDRNQITLIEIENINYYNQISGTTIDSINFRRNIVTEGIALNNLINNEFFIGEVKVKGRDLCQPCKELQDKLKQKNFVKKIVNRAGLRCEILTGGKIFVGDEIKE